MAQHTSFGLTGALILAGGLGTRFGGRKLLTPISGRPMLQYVLDLAANTGLDPVVVVLGTDADELLNACSWRQEIKVVNEQPEAGLATSVRLGLAALDRTDASRVAVLLGDQPFLTVGQVAAITARAGAIVVPRYDGRPGNPVVIERAVWPLAAQLEGDRGFSQLFSDHPNLVNYVEVPGANPDIDTLDDLPAISPS